MKCVLCIWPIQAHTLGAVNTHTHTLGAVNTHTHTWSSEHTHTHTPGAVDTHTPGAVDTHTPGAVDTHTHTWSSGHTHTPGAVDTHTHTHTHTPGAVDTHTHLEQWTHTHTHTHTHTPGAVDTVHSGEAPARPPHRNFIQDSLVWNTLNYINIYYRTIISPINISIKINDLLSPQAIAVWV